MQKRVNEPYLVDALSFTESEARIIKEMEPFISGEFQVSSIKRVNYSELFDTFDGDLYYDCKINFITLDERSGSEKKTAVHILVRAGSLDEAKTNLHEGMKGTLADYTIESIKETKIMDVYKYTSDSDKAD